jgi:hypothetical protein
MTMEDAAESVKATRGEGPTYPYSSFQGLRSLFDRLRDDGLPQVFDRSFFGDQSGSLIAQTRGTLRFFDLIDDDKRPTDRLRQLARADETDRVAILRDLAVTKYADVIALGNNATQGQLTQTFTASGLSGGSIPKATSFYLSLSEYVGLPVSPFFKKTAGRSTSGNGAGRRPARRKKVPDQSERPPNKEPERQPDSLATKRSAYIDLLMKLTEQSAGDGQIQENLLNRLERALGYDTSPDPPGE